VVTAIDHKPKTTTRLQRLRNIEAGSYASFLVDRYTDDWSRLWWVRVDGPASIHETGWFRDNAVTALTDKYSQYAAQPPDGPVIAVAIDQVTSWSSTQ
jgi:PPOX class probable F420-dependent enzyme